MRLASSSIRFASLRFASLRFARRFAQNPRSKFGALTCSIIGLARKVATLVASIYIYGHTLNAIQFFGLCVCITAMVMNFLGKGKKNPGCHSHGDNDPEPSEEKLGLLKANDEEYNDDDNNKKAIELVTV